MVITMKRILILFALYATMPAMAIQVKPPVQLVSSPSTSCPDGYIAIEEEYMTIADNACPNGYVSAGTADSCLVSSPAGACIMYAPANTTYSDRTGSYVFTQACPMTDGVSGGLPVIDGGQIIRSLP